MAVLQPPASGGRYNQRGHDGDRSLRGRKAPREGTISIIGKVSREVDSMEPDCMEFAPLAAPE